MLILFCPERVQCWFIFQFLLRSTPRVTSVKLLSSPQPVQVNRVIPSQEQDSTTKTLSLNLVLTQHQIQTPLEHLQEWWLHFAIFILSFLLSRQSHTNPHVHQRQRQPCSIPNKKLNQYTHSWVLKQKQLDKISEKDYAWVCEYKKFFKTLV